MAFGIERWEIEVRCRKPQGGASPMNQLPPTYKAPKGRQLAQNNLDKLNIESNIISLNLGDDHGRYVHKP